jgi:NAD(P)-dependent dehydrogenase (short-subunit alcohol dehydrogenase family)
MRWYAKRMFPKRMFPVKPTRQFVLVTGASTGIGRACAVRLAAEGFDVIATVRSDSDAKSIRLPGICSLKLDVTDADSIRDAAAQIQKLVGSDGLCGLVNNAGICVVGPAECLSLDQWRRQFDVNLFGVIAVTQAMLPLLRLHNAASGLWSARIVNISSITGEIATPLFGAYSASKFALGALSNVLRLELRADGIHVSTIVPGTIQSEIWRKEKEGVREIRANPQARRLYGPLIDRVSDYVFKCAGKAIPADRVAHAVSGCLKSQSPRSRYSVGWESDIGSLARKFIPDRLFNFLLGKTLGVPTVSSLPDTDDEILENATKS